jgi:hypothetical protein
VYPSILAILQLPWRRATSSPLRAKEVFGFLMPHLDWVISNDCNDGFTSCFWALKHLQAIIEDSELENFAL